MGDAGAAIGSGLDFFSQRLSEKEQAKQRDIDREREDKFNQLQQQNWEKQFNKASEIDSRNFNYQKQLNEIQMKREDTAVRRSIADHEAAGINKLLALGNQAAAGGMTTAGGEMHGGGAGGGISQHRGGELFSRGSQIMDNLVKQAEIGRTQAETEYTAQKTLTEFEETAKRRIQKLREKIAKEKDEKMRENWQNEIDLIVADINLKRKNAGLMQADIDTKTWDLNKSKEEGLRTNDAKDSKFNSGVAAANQAANTARRITEAAMDGEEIKSRKDDKFADEWEEGIHRNDHGEVIYEVFYDKRRKKLKRVWKNGKTEYKGY